MTAPLLKTLLENGDTPVMCLLACIVKLLGRECLTWEPESVRLELEDAHIAMPEENYDALFAAAAVASAATVFWDTHAFAQAIQVFNDLPAVPALIPQALPEHIAWGVDVILRLAEAPAELDRDTLFDIGPQTYMAACCVDAGLIVAPLGLEFVQEEMDRMSRAGKQSTAKIKAKWDAISSKPVEDLLEMAFTESASDVQLAQLSAVQVYTLLQREAEQAAMTTLASAL